MDHLRFLVTAGSTHEPIDAVRDWGNIFTGQTGCDIALELLKHGAVKLVTSNRNHAAEHANMLCNGHALSIETFHRHHELRAILADQFGSETEPATPPFAAIFMTAAISDYAPAGVFRVVEEQAAQSASGAAATPRRRRWLVEDVQKDKISSKHERIAVLGVPTDKLIDLFRPVWKHQGLLFKFKLEAGVSEEELIKIAQASRRQSQADYVVANTLEMARGNDRAAYIISEHNVERVRRDDLPRALVDVTLRAAPQSGPQPGPQSGPQPGQKSGPKSNA